MRMTSRRIHWLGLAMWVASTACGHPAPLAIAESSWAPLPCTRAEVMTDALHDAPNAPADRDLVGDRDRPTGARAADARSLFLRLRLDEDPLPTAGALPHAWALLLDLDRDLHTYEVQIKVDGAANTVTLAKNSVVTLLDDPMDPADAPAKSYPLYEVASRVGLANGFGNNPDYQLQLEIPWADLEPLGVGPSTSLVAWAATSSTGTALDGDLACADNGGAQRPTLSASGSVRTVLDPRLDTDRDGFTDAYEVQSGTDPNLPSSHPAGAPDASELAGGGGCASTGLEGLLSGIGIVCWALGRRRG